MVLQYIRAALDNQKFPEYILTLDRFKFDTDEDLLKARVFDCIRSEDIYELTANAQEVTLEESDPEEAEPEPEGDKDAINDQISS